ncbi:MAG: DEAD/DEAH box helicase [Owenweeksia sp.]|nr:DEAD/DEAH box helicase [Owenweeksia sp.]
MKFDEFGLNDQLLEAIHYMNFEEATKIQEQAIPIIMQNNDVIGCAQTGTGKTAAFILPTLHKIAQENTKGINTLVLVPTRELAMQIDQQIQGMAWFTNTSSFAVYGGGSGVEWEKERRALSKGADIVIATPGRLQAHMANGYVDFSALRHLILDEADRMLDIGFYDDIMRIIKELPKKRQSLLFSATMASKIRKLAHEILHEPKEINLAVSKPAAGVAQQVYLAHDDQKTPLVKHIISQHEDFSSILVFCSTKRKVEQVTRLLKSRNYNVEGISSDYDQEARSRVLLSFKAKNTRILVATDVMSRGIDIKDIDLVINYDVPNDAEDYVHRVGRTARAATKGLAITLISSDEMEKFGRIEKLIEREIDKQQPPDELGPGPKWDSSRRGGRGAGGRNQGKGNKYYGKKQGGKGANHQGRKGKNHRNKPKNRGNRQG